MKNHFKALFRSISASFPGAASLAQYWSELDSDAQKKEIQRLKERIEARENPILSSHSKSLDLLNLLHTKIETHESRYFNTDEEIMKYREALGIWENKGYLKSRGGLGKPWTGLRLENPYLLVEILSAQHGKNRAEEIVDSVLKRVQETEGGTNSKNVSEAEGIPEPYVKALFEIFETEGLGRRSQNAGPSVRFFKN